ncbi:hypothetical protein GCM10027176_31470 [Actinoallomurus bryophytorum]|uniref:Uncharacterized protein n=1 Tax=Actinoallomurus bryophytorum TaxID=1490222 RepID=A0A543CFZ2_9ACTN|nr:hypothetical protein [Actinoallomurus bryophytorum]TQL96004.1 hypothetical protein FB559_1521 [Actinoallomurus bryophytorum]
MSEGKSELPPWQQIMEGVNSFILNSVLGREGSVFIGNAWQVLLEKAPIEKRKTREGWKQPGWQQTPAGLPDSCRYMPETTDRQGYVTSGLEKLTRNPAFFGVCNDFAWVVTSALVTRRFTGKYSKQAALLPSGTRVEVFGITGIHQDKHLFTVVNRARDGEENDYKTWGPDCYVIDQWYALQTATQPVKFLVEGPFYDTEFVAWWDATVPGTRISNAPSGKPQSNSFKAMNEFVAGEF